MKSRLGHWLPGVIVLVVWTAALPAAIRPNILFILTDDQRYDALGCARLQPVQTPNLDRLATRGLRFNNAFVTLAICSPSRAAVLTGLYGSASGVTTVGEPRLNPGVKTVAHYLGEAGYRTGVVGKWHLGNTPSECGFGFARTFKANGPFYGREVQVDSERHTVSGFIDSWVAEQGVAFMEQCQREQRPFFLWLCTQVPHMNQEFDWNVQEATLASYDQSAMPVPETWQDDLAGKPPYLKNSRSRQQALRYGYDRRGAIQRHWQRYLAAVTEMDAALGVALEGLRRLGLEDNTVVVFMGDNGWFLGEHGFTSKVLPYEESMRVPLIVAAPRSPRGSDSSMALNIDVPVTLLAMAGLDPPSGLHGRNLLNSLPPDGRWAPPFRTSFLYEAPQSQLGSHPLWAVRTARWKYIRTGSPDDPDQLEFEELYDLKSDQQEMHNLAGDPQHSNELEQLRRLLRQHRDNPPDDADPNWAAALNGDIAAWMARAEARLSRGEDRFDRIEAYADYRCAARYGSALAQAKLAELEPSLSPADLQIAKIECSVCRAIQAERAGLVPKHRLKVHGVILDRRKRTALIDGQTFAVGDIAYVRGGPFVGRVKVECLEIDSDWVRIKADGVEFTLAVPGAGSADAPHPIEKR